MTTKKNHAPIDQTTTEGETQMTSKTETAKTASTTTVPVEIANPTPTTPATPTSSQITSYIAACSALLDQFDALFPKTDPLTTKDKQRTAKARKGSERYTPQLVALAKQHGVSLAAVPFDAITNASAESQQLVPLQKQMQRLNSRLSVRMFTVQATAWSGSSKLYAVLRRLSKDDGELQTGLEPVEQYFNHRHPLVAVDHPKTKKGKAALKAKEAAAAAEAPTATEPLATPPPAAPSPTTAANPSAPNGTPAQNGATHS
jgi:hypothetical protein